MASSLLFLSRLLFGVFAIPGTASRCEWADPVQGHLAVLHKTTYYVNVTVTDCKALCEVDKTCQAIHFNGNFHCASDGNCAWSVCAIYACGRCELFESDRPLGLVYDCLERSTNLIVGGGFLSVATGGITFAAVHRLVASGFMRSVFAAVFAASSIALLGAMPLLVSPNPARCADIEFGREMNSSSIFPLILSVSVFSVVGFVVACTKLELTNRTFGDPLAKCATIYFFCSLACNSVGVLGGILTTCFPRTIFRTPTLVIWIAGSIATNIILHKTLLLRARMSGNSRAERCSRIAFRTEVYSVLIATILACLAAIATQLGLSNHAYWAPVYIMGICCALMLFCSDFVLSFTVFCASYKALENVRSRVISQNGDFSLRRALSIAKLSLCTVVVSVVTTSVFYTLAMVTLAFEAADAPSVALTGALLIAWCVDSSSNDICAIIIGFVPISGALEIVASAQNADVIGAPLPNPSSRMEASVIGHVLPAATFDDGGRIPMDSEVRKKQVSL